MAKWQNKHHSFEHKNKHKFIHYFFYIKTLPVANSWDIYIYIYIYSMVNYNLLTYDLSCYHSITCCLLKVALPI